MRTQGIEFRGAWKRAGLASAAPAHWLAQDHRAAAAAGLGHRGRRWIGALTVSVLRIAQISSRI